MKKQEQLATFKKGILRQGAIQEEGEKDLQFAKRVLATRIERISNQFETGAFQLILTDEQKESIKNQIIKKVINDQIKFETPEVEVDSI